MLLQDKVVVVSGIGPGMGASIAKACVREGAAVVLAARTERAVDDLTVEITAAGGRALGIPTDIADESQCRQLVDQAVTRFGKVDVLVNNAFLSEFKSFENSTTADWRRIFDVNVFGGLQLTRAVAAAMKDRSGGSIVFINSMSTRIIEPLAGAYAASKGALMIAAQTLAKELGPYRIRVNSVVPGYIWSDKMAAYFRHLAQQQGTSYEAIKTDVTSKTALLHIPDSDEIADTVVFFASDLSRVVTGQALDVNGGHYFH